MHLNDNAVCEITIHLKVYFFNCACLLIFFWFLAIWLAAGAGSFYDILAVVQNSYFLAAEEWRQFSNSKHYPKIWKIHPIDTKDSKIQLTFMDLVPSPKCTFSDQNAKNHWPVLHVLIKCSTYIQLFFENNTYKYKYYNVQPVLKHKINKIP
jgi:hypothetical protein